MEDEKMQKNHTASVNKMIDIIKNETNKLNKPFKFLDLGCGNGWVVRKMSQHNNCKYSIGIDGSHNMIKKAKSYNIGDFEETTIESYYYKSKFDIIFSMETLYYLDDINQWQPSHIVISPGPGRPETAGHSVNVINGLVKKELPNPLFLLFVMGVFRNHLINNNIYVLNFKS